jgi:hypothetical protein
MDAAPSAFVRSFAEIPWIFEAVAAPATGVATTRVGREALL